jgi:hypothetical protein
VVGGRQAFHDEGVSTMSVEVAMAIWLERTRTISGLQKHGMKG